MNSQFMMKWSTLNPEATEFLSLRNTTYSSLNPQAAEYIPVYMTYMSTQPRTPDLELKYHDAETILQARLNPKALPFIPYFLDVTTSNLQLQSQSDVTISKTAWENICSNVPVAKDVAIITTIEQKQLSHLLELVDEFPHHDDCEGLVNENSATAEKLGLSENDSCVQGTGGQFDIETPADIRDVSTTSYDYDIVVSEEEGKDVKQHHDQHELPYHADIQDDDLHKLSTQPVHHYKFLGQPVYERCYTNPAVSLAILHVWPKVYCSYNERTMGCHLRQHVQIRNAFRYIDPVIYTGDVQALKVASAQQLKHAVTGSVYKYYTQYGTWTLPSEVYEAEGDCPVVDYRDENMGNYLVVDGYRNDRMQCDRESFWYGVMESEQDFFEDRAMKARIRKLGSFLPSKLSRSVIVADIDNESFDSAIVMATADNESISDTDDEEGLNIIEAIKPDEPSLDICNQATSVPLPSDTAFYNLLYKSLDNDELETETNDELSVTSSETENISISSQSQASISESTETTLIPELLDDDTSGIESYLSDYNSNSFTKNTLISANKKPCPCSLFSKTLILSTHGQETAHPICRSKPTRSRSFHNIPSLLIEEGELMNTEGTQARHSVTSLPS